MTGWIRRVLDRIAPTRRELQPLRSTRRQLNSTRSQHVRRIATADTLLRDWEHFDAAFRVVVKRPKT